MKAEIVGFSREVVNVEVENVKTKKIDMVQREIAIITLRSDIPEVLPVGKIVELTAEKENDK